MYIYINVCSNVTVHNKDAVKVRQIWLCRSEMLAITNYKPLVMEKACFHISLQGSIRTVQLGNFCL